MGWSHYGSKQNGITLHSNVGTVLVPSHAAAEPTAHVAKQAPAACTQVPFSLWFSRLPEAAHSAWTAPVLLTLPRPTVRSGFFATTQDPQPLHFPAVLKGPITNTGSLSPISKELFPIWALGSAAGYNWLPASIWFVWISSAHSSLRVTPGLHLSAPQHVGHKAGHSERQPQDTVWVTHTVMLWFVAPAALGFFSFCFLS